MEEYQHFALSGGVFGGVAGLFPGDYEGGQGVVGGGAGEEGGQVEVREALCGWMGQSKGMVEWVCPWDLGKDVLDR